MLTLKDITIHVFGDIEPKTAANQMLNRNVERVKEMIKEDFPELDFASLTERPTMEGVRIDLRVRPRSL